MRHLAATIMLATLLATNASAQDWRDAVSVENDEFSPFIVLKTKTRDVTYSPSDIFNTRLQINLHRKTNEGGAALIVTNVYRLKLGAEPRRWLMEPTTNKADTLRIEPGQDRNVECWPEGCLRASTFVVGIPAAVLFRAAFEGNVSIRVQAAYGAGELIYKVDPAEARQMIDAYKVVRDRMR